MTSSQREPSGSSVTFTVVDDHAMSDHATITARTTNVAVNQMVGRLSPTVAAVMPATANPRTQKYHGTHWRSR